MNIQDNIEEELLKQVLNSNTETNSHSDIKAQVETSEDHKDDNSLASIQDISKKLSMPENTIRKYLAYFELPVEKVGRKTCLTEESVQCLSEILQFKSNGLSLKQIKVLRDDPNSAGDLSQESVSQPVKQESQDVQKNDNEMNQELSVLDADSNDEEKADFAKAVESSHIHEFLEVADFAHIHNHAESISKHFSEETPPEINLPETDSSGNYSIENSSELESTVFNSSQSNFQDFNEEQNSISDHSQSLQRYQDQGYQGIDSMENPDNEQIQFDENRQDSFQQNAHNRGQRKNAAKQNIQKSADYREPLSKDLVNREIATQSKRASRLYRFLSSRVSKRDAAEIQADLNRRVEFINGLRYLRDNWLTRRSGEETYHQDRQENRDNNLHTDKQNLVGMN